MILQHAIQAWIENGKYLFKLFTFEREYPLDQEIIILGTKDACIALFGLHVPERQAARELSMFLIEQLHGELTKLEALGDSAIALGERP